MKKIEICSSKKITAALSLILFTSCTADYYVTKNKLAFQWPKKDNFYISEIHVDSLQEKKTTLGNRVIPVKYSRTRTVLCLTNESISKLFPVKTEDVSFQPSKKIYFYKKNKYYKWCIEPVSFDSISEILPITFEKDHW